MRFNLCFIYAADRVMGVTSASLYLCYPFIAKTFSYTAHGRWGIGNSLHWRMDVRCRPDS